MIKKINKAKNQERLLYLLLLLFCVAFVFIFACPLYASVQVTASSANVRTIPSMTAGISGQIKQNEKITVNSWSGEWAKIQYGTLQGWMHESVLSVKHTDFVQVGKPIVNLRSGPGTENNLVRTAQKGEWLQVLGETNGWYKVETADGKTAYILGTLTEGKTSSTSMTSDTSENSTMFVELLEDGVNIRSGPSTNNSVIVQGKKGEHFYYIATKDGWYQIRSANNQTAYVYSGVSKLVSGTADSTGATVKSTEISETNQSGAPKVYLNGNYISFDDVEPIIVEGRTLVPVRAIFEAMGAEINWVAATKTVVGTGKDGIQVVLPIGSSTATVDGQTINLDVPAQIRQDRTLAPLRFVGEAFGGTVNWDASTKRIDITSSVKLPNISEDETIISSAENQKTDVNIAGKEKTTVSASAMDVAILAHNRDKLTISTQKNELGLSINLKVDSGQLVPEAHKDGDMLKIDFAKVYVPEAIDMSVELGGGTLKIEADNTETGVTIDVTMPEAVEAQFKAEPDGSAISLIIENRIRGVGRKVYDGTDELIMIDTVVPVQYEYSVSGRSMEVVLKNTAKGVAESKYTYLGSVMSSMVVTEMETEDIKETHLLLVANRDCKFNTLLTDEGVLNIAVTEYVEDFVPAPENYVMLDAGHGGNEKGALAGEVDERHINLDITLKVGEYLRSQGVNVLYTRTKDATVSLSDRAEMANSARAAVFVSIHCNAATSESANGGETYFYAPVSDPVLFKQRMERQQLATCIQNNLIEMIGAANRGVKEQNLAVLRETRMPSALVECGFVSNKDELKLLLDENYQNKIARGIGDGIIEYMNMNMSNLVITPNF